MSFSTRACWMSSSSTEYGSRSLSERLVPLDLSADQRLQQQLRQRVRVQPRLRDRRGRRQRRRLGRAWRRRCDGGKRPGHDSCPFSRANTMRWPSAVPDASSVPDGSSSTPAVPRTRQPDAPRLQPRHLIDDHAALVERDDVDREPHAPRVHAPARHDPERLAGIRGRCATGARRPAWRASTRRPRCRPRSRPYRDSSQ